jgi:hypothetical protein
MEQPTVDEMKRWLRNESSKKSQKNRYHADEDYRMAKRQKALDRYHNKKALEEKVEKPQKQYKSEYYAKNAEIQRQKALARYYAKKEEKSQGEQ